MVAGQAQDLSHLRRIELEGGDVVSIHAEVLAHLGGQAGQLGAGAKQQRRGSHCSGREDENLASELYGCALGRSGRIRSWTPAFSAAHR